MDRVVGEHSCSRRTESHYLALECAVAVAGAISPAHQEL